MQKEFFIKAANTLKKNGVMEKIQTMETMRATADKAARKEGRKALWISLAATAVISFGLTYSIKDPIVKYGMMIFLMFSVNAIFYGVLNDYTRPSMALELEKQLGMDNTMDELATLLADTVNQRHLIELINGVADSNYLCEHDLHNFHYFTDLFKKSLIKQKYAEASNHLLIVFERYGYQFQKLYQLNDIDSFEAQIGVASPQVLAPKKIYAK